MITKNAEFLTELRVLDVTEGDETRTFELEEDFVVYSGVLDAKITVPAGFRCDGESIPSWLHGLAPPFGQSKRGAIVHDYLYRNHGYYQENSMFVPVSRSLADKVYRELVLAKGLPKWQATLRYLILVIAGWKAWNNNKTNDN